MSGPNAKPQLTTREREIVITALSAKASGSPVDAVHSILAAVAILDGVRPPMIVWPEESSREERAAWHEAEAAYWRKSAARYAAAVSPPDLPAPSVDTGPTSGKTGSPTVSVDTPQPHSA